MSSVNMKNLWNWFIISSNCFQLISQAFFPHVFRNFTWRILFCPKIMVFLFKSFFAICSTLAFSTVPLKYGILLLVTTLKFHHSFIFVSSLNPCSLNGPRSFILFIKLSKSTTNTNGSLSELNIFSWKFTSQRFLNVVYLNYN